MVSTRSNPGWGDIVTIRGRAEWFDSDHHKRFKRTPVVNERNVRAGTQEAPMTDLTLEFSEPPSNVSHAFNYPRRQTEQVRMYILESIAFCK